MPPKDLKVLVYLKTQEIYLFNITKKRRIMASIRVLLAGESWVSNSTHYKGWDFFSSTVYETGEEYIRKSV